MYVYIWVTKHIADWIMVIFYSVPPLSVLVGSVLLCAVLPLSRRELDRLETPMFTSSSFSVVPCEETSWWATCD